MAFDSDSIVALSFGTILKHETHNANARTYIIQHAAIRVLSFIDAQALMEMTTCRDFKQIVALRGACLMQSTQNSPSNVIACDE
jgi:hypothetical protein